MSNANLRAADRIKNDEFYTQYADIQKEVNAYLEFNPNVFKDKTILLPCDDPEWSNFTKFFAQNFDNFGLKKLISTSYAIESKSANIPYQPSLFEQTSPQYDQTKTRVKGKIFTLTRRSKGITDIHHLKWNYLKGDGDFRSEEVTTLRDEADIIVTNPPFSLFREFVAWINHGKKQFLIIGNVNAITYKEVFPLIASNKIWLGVSNGAKEYIKPDGNFHKMGNTLWFTNLDHGRRHQPLQLMSMAENLKFSRHQKIKEYGYQKYDNYDAIEVPFTDAIPSDYKDAMGVPISFLDKYCPEQFEILDGIGRYSILTNEQTRKEGNYLSMINGKALFFRLVIRHKGGTK